MKTCSANIHDTKLRFDEHEKILWLEGDAFSPSYLHFILIMRSGWYRNFTGVCVRTNDRQVHSNYGGDNVIYLVVA